VINFARKYKILLLLLILIMVLQACGGTTTPAPPEEPIKIKVQLLPFMSYSIEYIAEEGGFFDEEGLDVEFVEMFTRDAVAALAQGDLDVISGFLSVATLSAIAQGSNIRLVAGKGYVDTDACVSRAFLARKDLVEAGGLDDVAQMAGLNISINPVLVEGYVAQELLNTAGLTLDDMEITDLGSPVADLAAFETGAVDLSSSSEPWITRTVNAGNAVIWMPWGDIVPDFQVSVVLFGPSILDDNPDVGRRYLTAFFKAVQQYNEGKTERNIELIMAFTEMERELVEEVCLAAVRSDGHINVQSVTDFQNWAVDQGYLDSVVPEDQYLDTSFIDSVFE